MNGPMRSVIGIRVLVFATVLTACGSGTSNPADPATADTSLVPSTLVNEPLPQNGHARVTDRMGRLRMEGDMKDGQREGVWTSYDALGKVKSRNEYHGDKLNGISTVFRDNGALMYTGQYRNDTEVGTWQFYDDKGDLNKTVHYDSTGAMIQEPGQAPGVR